MKKNEITYQVFNANGILVRSWGEDFKTLKDAIKFIEEQQTRKSKRHNLVMDCDKSYTICKVHIKRTKIKTINATKEQMLEEEN